MTDGWGRSRRRVGAISPKGGGDLADGWGQIPGGGGDLADGWGQIPGGGGRCCSEQPPPPSPETVRRGETVFLKQIVEFGSGAPADDGANLRPLPAAPLPAQRRVAAATPPTFSGETLQTPDPLTGWCKCLENTAMGVDVVGKFWAAGRPLATAGCGSRWRAVKASRRLAAPRPGS
jgi:hypothetical protein